MDAPQARRHIFFIKVNALAAAFANYTPSLSHAADSTTSMIELYAMSGPAVTQKELEKPLHEGKKSTDLTSLQAV
jgi:hypothetical protein